MDNLDQINTVQDLLNIQDNPESSTDETAKQLLKAIYKQGPETGLAIVKDVLNSLYVLHNQTCERALGSKDGESAVSWSYDEAKLYMALQCVKDVVL